MLPAELSRRMRTSLKKVEFQVATHLFYVNCEQSIAALNELNHDSRCRRSARGSSQQRDDGGSGGNYNLRARLQDAAVGCRVNQTLLSYRGLDTDACFRIIAEHSKH
jgi:hypothetical protein